MWETALLVTMLQTFGTHSTDFSCEFPATEEGLPGISLTLEDRPSLKDQPGLYRVELRMNNNETLLATAQPIPSTGERDALVLARPTKKTVLTVGFRDDGKAALSLRNGSDGAAKTRIGECRGFESVLRRWLAS